MSLKILVLFCASAAVSAAARLGGAQIPTGSLTNAVRSSQELSPIVQTAQGELRGKVFLSRNGEKYYSFLGIPYASPPVYNLRFQPPSTPVTWRGIKQVTEFADKCVQFNETTQRVEGSEDCLYLNVFVPKLRLNKAGVTKLYAEDDSEEEAEGSQKFPVMVFIHGGNFMEGNAAQYGGKYFMDEKVILVTFNYRLGVFGFLNTGIREAQGNMGLKDQVVALKWVHENIEKFGGDKHRILVFGETAGAASVHYHMLSPMSKRLFSGALSLSGTALCPWAFSRYPKRVARKLGAMVNCPNSDMLELAYCLQGKDSNELIQKQAQLKEWSTHPISPFAPSVETTVDESDKFMSESPYSMILKKHENEVPWILSVAENEGLYEATSVLQNPQLQAELNIDWQRIAPVALYFRDSALEPDAVSNQIRAFYFGAAGVNPTSSRNLSNLYSDRLYLHGTRNSALLHARMQEGKPIYLSIFAYRSHYSKMSKFAIALKPEATQGDELRYLFNMQELPEIGKLDSDANFSRDYIRTWIHFANTGSMDKFSWNPISPAEVKGDVAIKYYQMNETSVVIEEPFLQRMNFWETLPLREYAGEDTMSPYSRNDFHTHPFLDY